MWCDKLRTTRQPKYIFPELARYRKKTIRLHPVRTNDCNENVPSVISKAICEEQQVQYIPIQIAGWHSDIRGFTHILHTSEELAANYLRAYAKKTCSKVLRGFSLHLA